MVQAPGRGVGASVLALLCLMPLRKMEAQALRWAELDLKAGLVTLPPERTKGKRKVVLPLPRQALAMFDPRSRLDFCVFLSATGTSPPAPTSPRR